MGSSLIRGHRAWIWQRTVSGGRQRERLYGTCQKVERMDYEVGGGHVRLGEIAVEEFNCIGENKILGDGIDHVEALVVLDRRTNVEALAAAEVP